MKTIIVKNPGSNYVLESEEHSIPVPLAHEILIRVYAIGINRGDVLQASGCYAPPLGASAILGLEVSGEIAALGSHVVGWNIADKVCALVPGGGYAEYVVAPMVCVLPIPKGYDIRKAASLPEACFTLWLHLHMLGKLQPKETLLLYGGSGGIGTLGIGWAKAMDARVIVTASGERKNALCYDLGADLVIDVQTLNEKDFSEHIQEFTCGKGCDVILDPLGGRMLQQNINNLSYGGRLVLLSFLEDSRASLNMARVLLKRLQILGGTVRGCLLEEKHMIANKLYEKIWPLLEEGKIAPVIDNIYDFDEAMEAHTRMRRREHFGKMLLLTKYSG